jgi:ornithine cyclodeaminase/alanine dehydrogenase-like protein (mu-crystallin family)
LSSWEVNTRNAREERRIAMPILVLTEQEIRQAVSMPEALEAMERAFAALARGEARLPDVIGLEVPEVNGEIHVKGAPSRAPISRALPTPSSK